MYEHRTVPMHADCLMRRLNAECGDIGVLCLGKGGYVWNERLKGRKRRQVQVYENGAYYCIAQPMRIA